MTKILLLDADGVLINGGRFSARLEKDFGIPMERTLTFFNNEFQKCLVGTADLKQEIKKYLSQWGWQTSVDELLDFWFASEHELNEELIAYIQQFRKMGMRCIVATNQEKYRAQYMLDQMGLARSFDGLYASAHLGHRKPTQEFFETLLQKIGYPDKKEVLFWDDTEVNVRSAVDFGIPAELFRNFSDFKKKMEKYS